MADLDVGEGSEGHSVSAGAKAAYQFHLLHRFVIDTSAKVPEGTDVVITESGKSTE